ncbi:MAG: HD domain-containing protein, partial [Bacteroidales bacterium]
MQTASEKYAELEAICAENATQLGALQKAYFMANAVLNVRKRENGAPFIFHALDVARIVACEIGIGSQAAIAVLLHEADRIKPINHETIKKDFGLDVAGIVQGLRKIAELNLKTTALQAETFRRLLLTYS